MDSNENVKPSQQEIDGRLTWVSSKLKDICERIYSGGTPFTGKPEYWNGNLPWLSSGETSNRLIRDTNQKITTEGVNNSSTRLALKGSTVIASAGQGHTRGQASLLMVDTYINQSVVALKGKEGVVDPYFLFYSLLSRYERLRQISDAHSIRGSLTTKVLSEESILLPPLKIQETVGQILFSLDLRIELNQQMNKTLESIAQALFKHWFIDFEFPDENGNPYKSSGGEMVDSELGEIPKEWSVGRLSDISLNFDSKRIPLSGRERERRRGRFPYYGAAAIMDFVDSYIFDGIYLLLGEDGTVIDDNEHPILQYVFGKFWVNNHAHVIQGKEPFTTEYLYLLLGETNIGPLVTGAVQAKINQSNLNRISVGLPTDGTLNQFKSIIDNMFSKVRNNLIEIQILINLRGGLLPKLMSGKIRLPLEDTNV